MDTLNGPDADDNLMWCFHMDFMCLNGETQPKNGLNHLLDSILHIWQSVKSPVFKF